MLKGFSKPDREIGMRMFGLQGGAKDAATVQEIAEAPWCIGENDRCREQAAAPTKGKQRVQSASMFLCFVVRKGKKPGEDPFPIWPCPDQEDLGVTP
ncbi:hypothetical protein NL676_028768 [Syzygium grande]|nr:hypothetical protein NL676_028768 [Syzygium grande]